MKKRIISLIMVFAMILSLVACTPNTTAYLDASAKINSWKGAKVKADLTYDIKIQNPEDKSQKINLKVPAKLEGISEGQDKAQINLSLDLKSLKAEIAKIGEEEAKEIQKFGDNLSFDMYVDGGRIIINKDLFTTINSESFKDIKEKYIELPSEYNVSVEAYKYLDSEEFKADLLDLYKTALPDFKPLKDYKVSGNTYSYEATSDDLLTDASKGVDSIIKNWDKTTDKLVKILTKLDLPKETLNKDEILKLKDSYKKEDLDKAIKDLKDLLKGTKISEKTTFEDDKVSQEVKVNLSIKDLMTYDVTINSVTTKDESVKVTIPTDVKKLTTDEYMKLFMGDIEPIVSVRLNGKIVGDGEGKIINDRTMLPCRSLFETLGSKVSYDEKSKVVTAKQGENTIILTIGKDIAKVNGKEVKLDSPAVIIENKTYVPARFVAESFGYKVKYEKQGIISLVDIYNISDEKLAEEIKKAEAEMLAEAKKAFEEAKADDKKVEEKKENVSEKIEESAKNASKAIFSVLR